MLRRPLRLLALILALHAPGLASAQDAAAPGAERFSLQLQDLELPDMVRAVSERTGVPFLFDDRLRGRVTITAPRPVTAGEALEMLVSALRVVGFATIHGASGITEIVPVGESAGRVPFSTATPRAFLDLPVTTLIPLQAAQADALLPIVQTLLGSNAVVQAFSPTNTLILSATEAQLHRVLLVVRALDRAEGRHLIVLRPRYRSGEDLLPLVQATFPESRRAAESLRIFADERTGSLIVEGPEDLVAEVKEFVRSLDRPNPGLGGFHVIRLHHSDAEDMAQLIQSAAAPRGSGQAVATDAGLLAGREFAVAVDPPTNSLVIRCDNETLNAIGGLVAELDVDVPLVTVRATLMEMENTGSLDVGVDSLLPFSRPSTPSEATGFARLLNSGDPSLLGAQPAEPGTGGLVFRYIDDSAVFERIDPDTGERRIERTPSWEVVVRALAQKTNTRILSEPMLVARSGEEQEIFIGDNIPIVSATQTAADGAGAVSAADPFAVSQNVERQDVGVTLRVSPNVPQEGPVRLEVRLEFSALTAPFAGNVDAVGPTLIEQVVESTIYLNDGEGAVVGVRGQPTREVTRQGTPWLMNVPGISWAFGSVSTRTVRRDLVMTIQIKVIRKPEDLEDDSIRRRIAMERNLVGLEGLQVTPGEAPFAVWVTTTEGKEAAEAVAASLELDSRAARVLPWNGGDPRRYDVFILGFDRYAEAMRTSLEVQSQGFDPEVVALPGSI